jgi:fructose/tagatose bisphosphate aldolase
MARITLRQLLDHAAENDYGLPAYNINNMEQGLAIMEAAEAVNAPVIIQARGAPMTSSGQMIDARPSLSHSRSARDHGSSPDLPTAIRTASPR